MAIRVNPDKSGTLSQQTIQIAIDGDSLEEVQDQAARDLALQTAAQHGYGDAGLSEQPMCGAVDSETNEILDGAAALDPNRRKNGWRAVYKINKRF